MCFFLLGSFCKNTLAFVSARLNVGTSLRFLEFSCLQIRCLNDFVIVGLLGLLVCWPVDSEESVLSWACFDYSLVVKFIG